MHYNEKIKISIKELIFIAEELWKTQKVAQNSSSENRNYKLFRELENFLKKYHVDILDLTGEVYDPGMSVEVIHFREVDNNGKNIFIKEMLSPIIMFRNEVIKEGEVIISNKKRRQGKWVNL